MGLDFVPEQTPESVRIFTKALLRDLAALERMFDSGMIESGITRIGAEQEMFLVNRGFRPSTRAQEILERLGGDPFTPELALFNLEVNLPPMVLESDAFSRMETILDEYVARAREAAEAEGAHIVLTGILPTLSKSDLDMENIFPRNRYYALNDALNRMRSDSVYRLRITGVDELMIEHDSVLLEACNTSAQVHLQVEPDDFCRIYNVAQAVTGPVLAASTNSPLLFGRRLWAETRIALFQQSLDTRSGSVHMREMSPRVRFGDHWAEGSVVNLFQEDVALFRVLLAMEVDEDPMAVLDAGGVPSLQALQLHNSTIYRWNRPCYGVGGGKPHIRIECRFLPSGPTVIDEMANAAFWIGLVVGAAEEYGDITQRMEFDDAKANFAAAAKMGLRSAMTWLDGEAVAAPRLILDTLLPLAEAGLESRGIHRADIDRYLGVIHDRTRSLSTGARWMVRSLSSMKERGSRQERLAALTEAIVRNQETGAPVHTWDLAEPPDDREWTRSYLRVEQYMTTQLFTVHEDELVDLVAFLMDRKLIRHVLIEDDEQKLTGIVSYRSVLRLISEHKGDSGREIPVREIMEADPVTVTPETPTLEAIELMRRHRVSCLPVTKDGKLVGIVSERDFMPIAYQLLEERLSETD